MALRGPAILDQFELHDPSICRGHTARVDEWKNIVITEAAPSTPGIDAIDLEVVKASLGGIVQEMQNSLFRTGFSRPSCASPMMHPVG